jgi:hypothetical protein
MTADRKKFIAFRVSEHSAPIRAGRRERKWMDETEQRFAYRCLPLVLANQFGWNVLSTHHIRATWSGGSHVASIRVEILDGEGPLYCASHFGAGVLSFLMPFLFRTPKDWNLMVRGPTNSPKDGIIALDGIVETDWAVSTFTMNWRFTRACSVEFVVGEPVCTIFPIQRGLLEEFDGEIRSLAADPDLQSRFNEWSGSRRAFLTNLRTGEPSAVKQGWQRNYVHDARETKSRAREFSVVPATSTP